MTLAELLHAARTDELRFYAVSAAPIFAPVSGQVNDWLIAGGSLVKLAGPNRSCVVLDALDDWHLVGWN